MPKHAKQLHSFKERSFQSLNRLEHGGDLAPNKRKQIRPLDPKRPLHLVLRSEIARGEFSMLSQVRCQHWIKALTYRLAQRYRIKLHRYSNNGNHLQLLLSFKTRVEFQNFLRVLAGHIAQRILKAKKGVKAGTRFWSKLADSRVLAPGRKAFQAVYQHVMLKEAEAFFERNLRPPEIRARL